MDTIELEQLARARAERLLTPAARADQNTPERLAPRAPEPSLIERMANIDRRWTEYAVEQKRALVADLLDVARRRFQAAVEQTHDQDVRAAAERLRHAEGYVRVQ